VITVKRTEYYITVSAKLGFVSTRQNNELLTTA